MPLLELLPLAHSHGDGRSSFASRCVERGARRGRAAIRAGPALTSYTSCGAWSCATILLDFPFGSCFSASFLSPVFFFFFGFASSFRSSLLSSFLPSSLALLLSSARCLFFSFFSVLCFLSPCRTQRTLKTGSTALGKVLETTCAARKTHRRVYTGSRDRDKDNNRNVRSTQSITLFRFIGDRTPK